MPSTLGAAVHERAPFDPSDLVTSLLRGHPHRWPDDAPAGDQESLLTYVTEHSVEALVLWHLQQAGQGHTWPEPALDRLRDAVRHEALLEVGRFGELRSLTTKLAERGIRALLVKGAALAYSRYPEPWLRPRSDNDVFVAPEDADAAHGVLTELGYARANVIEGERSSYQAPYAKTDRLGFRHVVDLHWKLSNRPRVADALPFDELWEASIAVPALGTAARAHGDVHALALACVHPVAHHRNSDNLVWIYDIHLLAGRLDGAGFEALTRLARERGIGAICASGLRRAAACFGTAVPEPLLDELDVAGESSQVYLTARAWRGDVRLDDLRATPGVRAKLQLVREVVLPDRAYMLREYKSDRAALLPLFHAHRLVRGCWRLARRLAR